MLCRLRSSKSFQLDNRVYCDLNNSTLDFLSSLIEIVFKVTGDSLLIHEFPYSLFIRLCSVASNMAGNSHTYHLIKLIYCDTPQRDVSSDKMVF